MKRSACAVGAVILGVAGMGCIAVDAKQNRFGSDLDAVVTDGHIYVVNKRTGKLAQINTGQLTTIDALMQDDDCD